MSKKTTSAGAATSGRDAGPTDRLGDPEVTLFMSPQNAGEEQSSTPNLPRLVPLLYCNYSIRVTSKTRPPSYPGS